MFDTTLWKLRTEFYAVAFEEAARVATAAHKKNIKSSAALRKEIQRRLAAEEMCRTDSLTGISNRKGSEEKLVRLIQQAKREYKKHQGTVQTTTASEKRRNGIQALVVLFADIDLFKNVNDNFGQETGDRVIKAVADQATRLFRRKNDVIARDPLDNNEGKTTNCVSRLGGEEFVIGFLCPVEKAEEIGLVLAEKLRHEIQVNCCLRRDKTIGSAEPNDPELARDITVSIGVAVLPPEQMTGRLSECADKTKGQASEAMKAAKGGDTRGGRNLVYLYNNNATTPSYIPRTGTAEATGGRNCSTILTPAAALQYIVT